MKRTLYFFFIISLFFVSCNGEDKFAKIVFRTWDDPFDDKPVIEVVYGKSSYAEVSWKEDEGADEFVLMKSLVGENGAEGFWQIYKGTSTHFTDNDLKTKGTYAYRLDKTRGNRTFEGKEISYIIFTGQPLPFPDTPLLTIDYDSSSCTLSWREDKICDAYCLERAEDSGDLNFTDIYTGTDTSFTDLTIKDKGKYIYRLSKYFNGRKYTDAESVYLYYDARLSDSTGAESAQNAEYMYEITTDAIADVRFDAEARVFKGRRWYKASIPAGKACVYTLVQITPSLLNGEELTLRCVCPSLGLTLGNINQGSGNISIRNTTGTSGVFAFSIESTTNEEDILQESITSYTLSFERIAE